MFQIAVRFYEFWNRVFADLSPLGHDQLEDLVVVGTDVVVERRHQHGHGHAALIAEEIQTNFIIFISINNLDNVNYPINNVV